ncbi:putative acyl carrier protein [Hibiscus syriacus]|uniref:Acyl carrier protein n=1 Tax=Hibiscus syriacus TaxID=106335 RepID=A0A6A2XVU8_HIBSY|nr:putative invertase inhibitor [Hibiscus syriacus]KAE8679842.1 putative acyl carrier protein [Hibiscus syriacus]
MRQRSSSSLAIPLFLSFFLLISTSTSHSLTSTNSSLIRKTCKKCAESDPNLSYDFCVTSLQAAPNSHCANDLRQLGKISIKLLRRNLTNSRSYIKELLKNKKMDPFVRSCLHDCFDLYSDAILTAKHAIEDYKDKRYDDSNIGVSSIMDAATTCEDGFKEKEGVVSPLTKRNNDIFQLSVISLSIINMIRLNHGSI